MRHFVIKLVILLGVCGTYTTPSFSQRENVWTFGKNAGVDFNASPPVAIKTNISSTEACASVCDERGQLLFYTHGTHVWDKNGNIVPNGANLTPVVLNGSLSGYPPTESTSQGAVIIPFLNDKNKYFIFSLTMWGNHENFSKLFYSVVDLSLNNGNGDVVPGMKGVLLDSNLTEAMTSVVGDRCNIWLLVAAAQEENKHVLKAYEITESGIDSIPVISNGFPIYFGTDFYTSGQFAVSPLRNKIALTKSTGAGGTNGLALFRFDPVNGRASNYQQLSPDAGGYGACFSPNGEKLYFNTIGRSTLYQYDLSLNGLSEIIASKTAIEVATSPLITIKIAPDSKIYFRGSNATQSLSRINSPNNAGMACAPENDVITLLTGTTIHLGLPTNIAISKQLHDTFYTRQSIMAVCFANANKITIRAQNDSTGWDYQWNNGLTNAAVQIDTPGTYWITYRSAPCNFHTDTFMVTFPNGVLPTIIIDTACLQAANGQAYAATYPGDTVQYDYLWQNQLGDTLSRTDQLTNVYGGHYNLRVRTASCDTSLTIYIPEVDYKVSFLVDSIVCTGSEIVFNNQSDSHFKQFHWSFGDGDVSNDFSPTHTYTQAGSYNVALIGTGSICQDYAFHSIEVDARFSTTFLAQPDSICVGTTITFQPQAHSSAVNLHWQWGDGTGITTENEPMLQHAYPTPGNMPVTLTTQFRVCPDTSFSDTLHVFPLPIINLGQDSELCLDGQPLLLHNAEILPRGQYLYLWNTGATTEQMKVTQAGHYSLTISDRLSGCSATESITVAKDCYTNIPNAFTPDGDGINDYFFPRQLLAKGLNHFRMQILNRWGQLLFETNNTSGRGWDGQYNGKKQPQGVYIYKIEVAFENGHTQAYNGHLTLIR